MDTTIDLINCILRQRYFDTMSTSSSHTTTTPMNMSHKSNSRIKDEDTMRRLQPLVVQSQQQSLPSFCCNRILLEATSCSCSQCSSNSKTDSSSHSGNDESNGSRSDRRSFTSCKQDTLAESTIMTKVNRIRQQTTESEFYKFLGRFSGRRRYHRLQRTFHKLSLTITSILILISLCSVTEACSSRTTPKPRPPPTTTPRPNITFHTYKCPPAYAAWYCLNEATCFTVKIGDEILYNCECADGYMGPRCEYKDLDGTYLPTRPRVMLETASIASGATLALLLVLILCMCLYVKCNQRRKLERYAEDVELDVDTVDGVVHVAMRPFGPHHQGTLPMSAMLKR